jgi:hypothetical protein
MNNRDQLLRKGTQTGDNSNFMNFKSKGMTIEKISQQKTMELAAMRFKTIVAEANEEVRLKLPAEAGVHGFIVLLQPPLPSIR